MLYGILMKSTSVEDGDYRGRVKGLLLFPEASLCHAHTVSSRNSTLTARSLLCHTVLPRPVLTCPVIR